MPEYDVALFAALVNDPDMRPRMAEMDREAGTCVVRFQHVELGDLWEACTIPVPQYRCTFLSYHGDERPLHADDLEGLNARMVAFIRSRYHDAAVELPADGDVRDYLSRHHPYYGRFTEPVLDTPWQPQG